MPELIDNWSMMLDLPRRDCKGQISQLDDCKQQTENWKDYRASSLCSVDTEEVKKIKIIGRSRDLTSKILTCKQMSKDTQGVQDSQPLSTLEHLKEWTNGQRHIQMIYASSEIQSSRPTVKLSLERIYFTHKKYQHEWGTLIAKLKIFNLS